MKSQIPITFYPDWFGAVPDAREHAAVLGVERERVRQRGLLELALEALGRGDVETVEKAVNKMKP